MIQITLSPGDHRFACAPDQTILEAALAANLLIPYGCKSGSCGSCKGDLNSGAVDYGKVQATTLTDAEKASGKALFCCAKPLSDVAITARDVRKAGDIQMKRMPARVESLTRASDDAMIVKLRLPATEKVNYKPGMYLDVLLRDGRRRSFSMASRPGDEPTVELHIRHLAGGAFTDTLFAAGKEKDIWRIEAPFGSFFLRDESDKPIVFVASGTGFAPIKAIVEQALVDKLARPMVLYWGGRRPKDLYMHALAAKWQDDFAALGGSFTYIPVVSDALAEDAWTGRTGFVHKAVMADFPDLSGYQVYACGAPIVVDSARREFVAECKLPEGEFFADSFTIAAEAEASK